MGKMVRRLDESRILIVPPGSVDEYVILQFAALQLYSELQEALWPINEILAPVCDTKQEGSK